MSITAPFTVVATGMRHMMDVNVTFGTSSSRFNARDAYRREYTPGQRSAAGLGTAFGAALPAVGLYGWLKKGAPTGIAPKSLPGTLTGKAIGAVALGAAAAVGGVKLYQIVQDDGHLGSVGATTGILGGAVGAIKFGKSLGKYQPLATGAAMIAGGVGGYAGKLIHAGKGHIGEENKQAANNDSHRVGIPFTNVGVDVSGAPGRAVSFGRGALSNFNETGPTSQGFSFGYAWGMQDKYKTKYSNSERAGAMHGDLIAAGILGGGALTVAAALMGTKGFALEGKSALSSANNAAGHVLGRGIGSQFVNKISELSIGKTAAVGAAAGILSGAIALKEWDRAKDGGASDANAALWAGGSIAATAGLAFAISKTGAMSHVTGGIGAKAAGSTLVAASLIAVLGSARLPVQQFLRDAQSAHDLQGGKTDWSIAAPAMAVGGAALGVTALKGLGKYVPEGGIKLGKFHIPKGVLVAAGTTFAGIGGTAVGWGLSATMPNIKKVGISAGVGAVGGAALGAALPGMRNRMGGPLAAAAAGAIVGGLLGMSTSGVWNKSSTPEAAPTTPQDAAGTAT